MYGTLLYCQELILTGLDSFDLGLNKLEGFIQILRLCLDETGSVLNRYEIGTNKPCVYMDLADL